MNKFGIRAKKKARGDPAGLAVQGGNARGIRPDRVEAGL
jgi:hypothetical protein